jgi:nitrite reductase/ring-hydroxylating ferredoxin subunit/uncharacterized membrane protein
MTGWLERLVKRTPKVDELGTDVSLAIHNAVLQGGPVVRNAVDVLHGKQLGHPMHPILTQVAIGAWCMGGLFDAVAAGGGPPEAAWAADRLIEIGTVAAVPTALTGLADFSTFPEWAAKPATLHAIMNVLGVGLFTASIAQRRRGNIKRGRALSWSALGLAAAAGWLGGQLVSKHKMGVDHSDRFSGPKKWTPVLEEQKLPPNTLKRITVRGAGVLLYRDKNRISAIGSVCSHAGGPLEEGKVAKGCVTCPWHDSVFRLSDGSIIHGPATRPQPCFNARVRNGQIEVRLANDPGAGVDRSGRTVVGAPA